MNITTKQITISAMLLSIIIVLKLLERVMPLFLSFSIFEPSWVFIVVIVLIIPFRYSLLITAISPVVFAILGQISWGTNPFTFFLDYLIPYSAPLIIYTYRKNIFSVCGLILIAWGIKLFSHVVSGVIFYEAGWIFSFWLNTILTVATMGASIIIVLVTYKRLRGIRSGLIANGTF